MARMRISSSLLTIVLGVCAGAAFAQAPPDCHGPDVIERALAKQPSADAYNALGAWFAQHNQIDCAIPEFRSAIRLQPDAWDSRFNLALALQKQQITDRAETLGNFALAAASARHWD